MTQKALSREIKPILHRPVSIGLIFLVLTILAVVSLVLLPVQWTIAGALAIAAIVLWALLWLSGRDFEVLFLVIFAVGYVQGLIAKWTGDAIPWSLWGFLKYGLLLTMAGGYALRALMGKSVLVNRAMRDWLVVWGLVWAMLGFLMLEARNASALYTPIVTIQLFGVGNMLMAVMTFWCFRPKHIDASLRLLVWAGLLAAAFGVAQSLMGPDRLAALGLLKGSHLFLNVDIPEMGFVDTVHGLRAFSFFDSHHAFSAFLILCTVALQILRLKSRISRSFYLFCMAVLWAGFTVTFNLTNMLTCLLALVILVLLERIKGRRSFLRTILNRRLWQVAISTIVIVLAVVMVIAPLRNRLMSLFDVRFMAAGAGGSLAGRMIAFKSGIRAIIDYPLGFGLYLSPISPEISELVGRYARVNDYFASRDLFFGGDNFFQWLMIQVGLPGFALYTLLFLIPIIWGLRRRKWIRDHGLRILMNGILALMISTFIGGVSNSPILVFPPSNLLIWAAAGILMKLPSWDMRSPEDALQRP